MPNHLIIGKSLATYAARVAAQRELRAVWLTPLLADAQVVDALRGCARPSAWDSDAAHALSRHVLEVDGADHGMFVSGDLAASAAVLGSVATAIEEFLDQTVWTSEP
jgi:hypothetical protein